MSGLTPGRCRLPTHLGIFRLGLRKVAIKGGSDGQGHCGGVDVAGRLARDCDYHDLGADHYERRSDANTREQYYIRQLEALGHKVNLGPAA